MSTSGRTAPAAVSDDRIERAAAAARQSGRVEQAVYDAGDGVQLRIAVAPDGTQTVWHVGMWEPDWRPPISGMTPTTYMRIVFGLGVLVILAIALAPGSVGAFLTIAVVATGALWLLERRRPTFRTSGAIAEPPGALTVDTATPQQREAVLAALRGHLLDGPSAGLGGDGGPTPTTHRALWATLQRPARRNRGDVRAMFDPRGPRRR